MVHGCQGVAKRQRGLQSGADGGAGAGGQRVALGDRRALVELDVGQVGSKALAEGLDGDGRGQNRPVVVAAYAAGRAVGLEVTGGADGGRSTPG